MHDTVYLRIGVHTYGLFSLTSTLLQAPVPCCLLSCTMASTQQKLGTTHAEPSSLITVSTVFVTPALALPVDAKPSQRVSPSIPVLTIWALTAKCIVAYRTEHPPMPTRPASLPGAKRSWQLGRACVVPNSFWCELSTEKCPCADLLPVCLGTSL